MSRLSPRRIAALNRVAWDGMAEAWARRRETRDAFRALRRFRRGTLADEEVRMMGPVRGRTLLHLQCGSGEDTLSWAGLGARATGLDLAAKRLEQGRAWAVRLRRPVTFVAGDVMRLPFRARSFDRVYASRGALVWIPALPGWAREIARVLKPGGRFLLNDEHPFLYCLVQRNPRRAPVAAWNYFDQRPHVWRGWWFSKDRGPETAKVETDWTLSALLNALTGAGLRLAETRESPEVTAMDFTMPRGRRRWLPRTLMLRFDRPR